MRHSGEARGLGGRPAPARREHGQPHWRPANGTGPLGPVNLPLCPRPALPTFVMPAVIQLQPCLHHVNGLQHARLDHAADGTSHRLDGGAHLLRDKEGRGKRQGKAAALSGGAGAEAGAAGRSQLGAGAGGGLPWAHSSPRRAACLPIPRRPMRASAAVAPGQGQPRGTTRHGAVQASPAPAPLFNTPTPRICPSPNSPDRGPCSPLQS